MNVRDSRLSKEYHDLKKQKSNVITWETIGPDFPAYQYLIHYDLKSIVGFDSRGYPVFHKGFDVKIRYPLSFPEKGPVVSLASSPQLIHPNIYDDGRICFEGEQNWVTWIGFSLHSLIYMLGKIIAYQEVNLPEAATSDEDLKQWVKENFEFDRETTTVLNPVDPSEMWATSYDDVIIPDKNQKDSNRIVFGDIE